MSLTRNPVCWLACAAAALSSAADAQRAPVDSSATLPSVSVTGSRSGMAVFAVPLAVTQVAPSAWAGKSGYGLDNALVAVPGVLAQSRYGNSDIRLIIRGYGSRGAGDRSNSGTSRGVRVLLNGIPETEPDGRTSFDNIDLLAAQSIEVVRSNASALWGNAAGGVVNVSTVPTFESAFAHAEASSGGFGLKRIGIQGGAPLGTGRAYATVANSSFDGWRKNSMSNRTVLDGGIIAPLGEATELRTMLTASLNRFNVPGPLTQAQMDADPTQANATYLARRERRDNKIARVAFGIDHKLSASKAIASQVFVQQKYLQRSERNTYRDFNRYHGGGNFVFRAKHGFGQPEAEAKGTLTLGTDLAYQDGSILFYGLSATQGRGTNLTDNKREGANNVGVFLSEDLELGDRWVLALGARYDAVTYTYSSNITPASNTTKSFTGLSPKIGLTFRPRATESWYANIGGGIEVPAGNEMDPEAGTVNAVFAINPLLDPIRSTTFEVGTRRIAASSVAGSFIESLSYDASAFVTTVSNEIVPYNGGRFYFSAGSAKRSGLELGGTIQAKHGWSLSGAATWMNARYEDYVVDSAHYAKPGRFADYSGNAVVGVPSLILNGTLSWTMARVRGLKPLVGMQQIGSYYADDANSITVASSTVWNAGIVTTNALTAGSLGVRGSLLVTNLRNSKYVGSAYLNPDRVSVNGQLVPAAFEPGLPRQLIVTLSLERRPD
ncbi:MAG: TonB-dependent receptor [Gemmatimonadetes bacterium]|nr:TonB-dependent receptor [Gemmatimonadota bacterium]